MPLWLWQKASPWLFMLGTGFLVFVLIPGIGREVNGARRWISMGIGTFQPSELMKLFVVLYAADYTVRKAAFMDDFRKGFVPMFVVMTIIAALLLREPDFGALVVVTTVAMAVLFLGGLNWRLFAGLAVLLAAAFVVLIVSSPYREKVIQAFKRHKTPLHMDIELPTLQAIKRFVAMGNGVALLPAISVENELARGELARIPVRELRLHRKLRLVYRQAASLSHAARAFLKVAEAFAQERRGPYRFQRER